MQNNGPFHPGVEKISRLIDALKDYAVKEARVSWEEQQSVTYRAPYLAAWDALAWFDLVHDWGLVDFIISDTARSRILVKSLQSCLTWYGQAEINETLSHTGVMSMIN